MSFFVKAAVDALQTVPAVNARIDGTDIIYRKYQDIGIAVGGWGADCSCPSCGTPSR